MNDGVDHVGHGVAENERSPGADVVDVLVAVGVPDIGTFAAHQERRIAAHRAKGPDRRVHASGDELFGALLQRAGLVEVTGHDDEFLFGKDSGASDAIAANIGIYQGRRSAV